MTSSATSTQTSISDPTNKNLLFVFRTPPYGSSRAQEGLDALLAGSVFGQNISVLFMGDGVFQLQANQTPVSGKNQQKMLQALGLYDIDQVFVQASALRLRNIASNTLNIAAAELEDFEIGELNGKADHIFCF